MKKPIALLALAAALIVPAAAQAAAHPTAVATQIDARTFTLDASSSPCAWRYCTFSWRAYSNTTNRIGYTAGFGPTITWTAPTAGAWSLMVTQSEFCAPTSQRSCPGVFQVNVTAT